MSLIKVELDIFKKISKLNRNEDNIIKSTVFVIVGTISKLYSAIIKQQLIH